MNIADRLLCAVLVAAGCGTQITAQTTPQATTRPQAHNITLLEGRGELLTQTQRRQLADGVGLQIDAVAQRAQRRHRLVDPTRHADLVQAQRLGQSGDAAPDDDDLHSSVRWQRSPPSIADYFQAIDGGLSFNTAFSRPSSLPP